MPRVPQSGHLFQRQPQEPLRAGCPEGPALLSAQPRASWGLCAGREPRSPDSGHHFNVFNTGHLKTPLSIRAEPLWPSWENPGRVSYVLSRCVLARDHTGICEPAHCPPLPGSLQPQTPSGFPHPSEKSPSPSPRRALCGERERSVYTRTAQDRSRSLWLQSDRRTWLMQQKSS